MGILTTRFCELLEVEHPLANAGMGPFTRAPLAAAVSNAGGLGTLGAAAFDVDELLAMIAETRELTDRPFAMNLILPFQGVEALEAVAGAGVAAIATGFGDPEPAVEIAHAAGVKVMHRCVHAEEAAAAAAAGVDVIIAQSSDAGGHTGAEPGMSLFPAVVDAAGGVPVLCAGGIADGRGLLAALALGADGAILGTRFIACEEARCHDEYRRRLVGARARDTVVTDIVGGREWPDAPTRSLRNSTIAAWEAHPEPRPDPLAGEPEIIGTRHLPEGDVPIPRWFVDPPWPEDTGDIEAMTMYAGTSVELIHDVRPAADIVASVMSEARAALDRLAGPGVRARG